MAATATVTDTLLDPGLDPGEASKPHAAAPSARRLLDRVLVRYAASAVSVGVATVATFSIDRFTDKALTFPFYAAVVLSAWLGAGQGLMAIVLSVVAVEFLWASPYYSLRVEVAELPWFLSFIVCMLMSFAWSWQRRRAQRGLEATVRARTAELLQANAALQAEMAEREAAQRERDASERALRTAESELTRALRLATMAEMAAAIAHEINQPLAAITANAGACLRSLSREPPLLGTAREAADCIVSDGHRAGDVIARVRALFNREAPHKQPVAVNAAVRHVLDLSRDAVARQGVTVAIDLCGGELCAGEPVVLADPVQLQQVMINLVTNALEAMAGNGPQRPRRLTVRSTMAGDAAVTVAVEDTGSGLDPDAADRIFDSFYTTKPGGVGLGLAISRSIIEAHDGTMWARPGEESGASLGFSLPLAPIM